MAFSQTDKDLQIVTCLLLPEFHRYKKTRFTREDVLDLWVQQERFLGNKKAESFLRNRLLRPRLTSLIKSLQKVPNAHLSIAFSQAKRGRPKVLLVLNKWD